MDRAVGIGSGATFDSFVEYFGYQDQNQAEVDYRKVITSAQLLLATGSELTWKFKVFQENFSVYWANRNYERQHHISLLTAKTVALKPASHFYQVGASAASGKKAWA